MMVATLPARFATLRAIQRATELARVYDDHAAAAWRGEPGAAAFGDWLGRYWQPEVVAPAGPPVTFSPCGGGGKGLVWYDIDGAVLGLVPGVAGGYWVPVGAVPPVAWRRPDGGEA